MSRATITAFLSGPRGPCAQAQTLAPGKPAGVQTAQRISYRTGFIGMSIIAVALTFGLPPSETSTASTATTS